MYQINSNQIDKFDDLTTFSVIMKIIGKTLNQVIYLHLHYQH